jgi:hypothetical protein
MLIVGTVVLTVFALNDGGILGHYNRPAARNDTSTTVVTTSTVHYQDGPPTDEIIDQKDGLQWNSPHYGPISH